MMQLNNHQVRRVFSVALGVIVSCAVVAHTEERSPFQPVELSKNQTIVLSDSGLTPRELSMRLEDSVVFFVNKSSSPEVTIAIDYGSKETHCASSNLMIAENGVVRSRRPIAPRDFASVCFHDRGSYPLTVAGLRGTSAAIRTTIRVE